MGGLGAGAGGAGDEPARDAGEAEDEGAIVGANPGERWAAAFAALGHGVGSCFLERPARRVGLGHAQRAGPAGRPGTEVLLANCLSGDRPSWRFPSKGTVRGGRRQASGRKESGDGRLTSAAPVPGLRAILGMTSAPPGRDHLPDIQTLPREGAGGPDGIFHRHLLRLAWFGVPRTRQGRYPLPRPHPGRSAWPTERYRCGPCRADGRRITPVRTRPDSKAVKKFSWP